MHREIDKYIFMKGNITVLRAVGFSGEAIPRTLRGRINLRS